jgi:hypothetical protein
MRTEQRNDTCNYCGRYIVRFNARQKNAWANRYDPSRKINGWIFAMKKGRLKSNLEGLSKESGIVIKNEKLAVYKDHKGEMHKFSAVCTI